jgi:hypothetical protein
VSGAVSDLLRSLQTDDDTGAASHAVTAHFHIAPLLASQSVYVPFNKRLFGPFAETSIAVQACGCV